MNDDTQNGDVGSADDRSVAVARTNPDLDHHNALRLAVVRIRLFDPESQPMPATPYRLTIGGQTWEDTAHPEAWIEQHVLTGPGECLVEWGPGEKPGAYLYSTNIYLDFREDDGPQSLKLRLHNLGYPEESSSQNNLAHFRHDYGLSDTDDHAAILEGWHDDPETVKVRVKNKLPDDAPPGAAAAGSPTAPAVPSPIGMAKQALNGLSEAVSSAAKGISVGFGG